MNPPTDKDSWTVTTWGDVRPFPTIQAALTEAKEALELGLPVSIRRIRASEETKGVMVKDIDRCANRRCDFNTVRGTCWAEKGVCFGYVEPPKAEQPA